MALNFPAAWHPQVLQVQTHVYAQPQLAIEAARKLLKDCHQAYVYEPQGYAHLRLGKHRLSCVMYEQARCLQPQNMYVPANMRMRCASWANANERQNWDERPCRSKTKPPGSHRRWGFGTAAGLPSSAKSDLL